MKLIGLVAALNRLAKSKDIGVKTATAETSDVEAFILLSDT
jgi:hypothetical protein